MYELCTNTRESILQSKFALIGKELNRQYDENTAKKGREQITRWEMKNALRELNQKRLKNNRTITKLKRECRRKTTGEWVCPHCKKEVRRLTSAHVGEPVCKILDKILDEHFPEKNLTELYSILRTKHDDIYIVICCDDCNKKLEDDDDDAPSESQPEDNNSDFSNVNF